MASLRVTFHALYDAAHESGYVVRLKSSHEGQQHPERGDVATLKVELARGNVVWRTIGWRRYGQALDAECGRLLDVLRAKQMIA